MRECARWSFRLCEIGYFVKDGSRRNREGGRMGDSVARGEFGRTLSEI